MGAAGFALQGVVAGGLAGDDNGHTGTGIPGEAGTLSGFVSTAAGYLPRREDPRKQRTVATIERHLAERHLDAAVRFDGHALSSAPSPSCA